MCDRIDPIKQLLGIPFRVAALQKALTIGSYQHALAGCVYDSVRKDIDSAVTQLVAEREEAKRFTKGTP